MDGRRQLVDTNPPSRKYHKTFCGIVKEDLTGVSKYICFCCISTGAAARSRHSSFPYVCSQTWTSTRQDMTLHGVHLTPSRFFGILSSSQCHHCEGPPLKRDMERCMFGSTLSLGTCDETQSGETSVDRCFSRGRSHIGDCINRRGTKACGMVVEEEVYIYRCLHRTSQNSRNRNSLLLHAVNTYISYVEQTCRVLVARPRVHAWPVVCPPQPWRADPQPRFFRYPDGAYRNRARSAAAGLEPILGRRWE